MKVVQDKRFPLPGGNEIEVYRDPSGSSFRGKEVIGSGSLACESIPSIRIEVPAIFPN